MREKQLKIVVTFHTTADAMAMERLCAQRGISGRLMPAPRAMTADCGIAWCSEVSQRQGIAALGEEIPFADCRELMV